MHEISFVFYINNAVLKNSIIISSVRSSLARNYFIKFRRCVN